MAKRKSTVSGRDPNESAAPVEGASEVVADATVEDAPVLHEEISAESAPRDGDVQAEEIADSLTDDAEPPLEEDLPGEDLASDLPDPGPYEIAADEDEAEELDSEADEEDPEQLEEAEEFALAAASTLPVRRPRSSKAPVKKKDAPTRSRKEATLGVTEQRTGPVTFVKQSISELRKVVWPTGSQLTQYFVVVLIFVMFMIALVSVLDFAFGWALLKALG
ncbi:MAG TPA: preprotein translocase subunit SecE [Propionibacteriaceae bacterium]